MNSRDERVLSYSYAFRPEELHPADRLVISITLPLVNGETDVLQAPLNRIIAIRHFIKTFGDRGADYALSVALLGVAVREQPPSSQEVRDNEIQRIRWFIHQIQTLPSDLPEQISYDMLQRGSWTRKEAAEMATAMLGRKIETDTWRKRVDLYASKKGWTELELPTGRRKKPENA